MLLKSTYVLCAEETNEIQAVSEEHGLQPTKASVQGQAAVDGARVRAEKLDQHTRAPVALLAKPEDSQYPEREQLVIRDGQKQQHAAEEGGWLWVPRLQLVSTSSVSSGGPVHSFVYLFIIKRTKFLSVGLTSRVNAR